MFGMGDAVSKDLEYMAANELMRRRMLDNDQITNFSVIRNSVKYEAFVYYIKGDEARMLIYNLRIDGQEINYNSNVQDLIKDEWLARISKKPWWKL